MRREQHRVCGAGRRAEILLVLLGILGAHLGGRDQRRRAVKLARRLWAGSLLERVQRWVQHSEAPRVGEVMVRCPARELEQFAEQLPGNRFRRERLMRAAAANCVIDVHRRER